MARTDNDDYEHKPGEMLAYPPDAFINKETGMYQAAERKPNTEAFEQREDGMWVPRPRHKPHRRLLFGTDGYIDCVETIDQCKLAYDTARTDETVTWFTFIDPVYGTACAVPREKLLRLQVIAEAWTDIEEVKEQIAQHEQMKRMQRINQGGKRH